MPMSMKWGPNHSWLNNQTSLPAAKIQGIQETVHYCTVSPIAGPDLDASSLGNFFLSLFAAEDSTRT